MAEDESRTTVSDAVPSAYARLFRRLAVQNHRREALPQLISGGKGALDLGGPTQRHREWETDNESANAGREGFRGTYPV
jgi:hypothetical protein